MATSTITVLSLALVFGLTSCQQCDVVVTSQAAIQEQIRDALNEFTVNGSVPGLISTENVILNKLNQMTKQISSLQQQISLLHQPGVTPSHPADSCADVLRYTPDSPSGYYWVKDIHGHSQHVYCDMTRTCGGVTGGWMRVAELDMTHSSSQCPSGLRDGNYTDKRTCVITSDAGACSALNLPTSGIPYTMVCGKVRAYQYGSTDAFTWRTPNRMTIDSNYVDGISLTHGSPREHIWTFASAVDEVGTIYEEARCPCTNVNAEGATASPDFVGNDYFCDTGTDSYYFVNEFYGVNPLWDGAGCGSLNQCCSFNNPPWFYKQLSQPTNDDIEMRVCRDEDATNENVAIEKYEFYVY